MAKADQQRVILLQRALKVADDALLRIEHGFYDPTGLAETARYEIMRIRGQIAKPRTPEGTES